jgi:hypothetical protein
MTSSAPVSKRGLMQLRLYDDAVKEGKELPFRLHCLDHDDLPPVNALVFGE